MNDCWSEKANFRCHMIPKTKDLWHYVNQIYDAKNDFVMRFGIDPNTALVSKKWYEEVDEQFQLDSNRYIVMHKCEYGWKMEEIHGLRIKVVESQEEEIQIAFVGRTE